MRFLMRCAALLIVGVLMLPCAAGAQSETPYNTPEIAAEASLVLNPTTNAVLWEQQAHTQRSIASLTKVMTAWVFLNTSPDLTAWVTVRRTDTRGASRTRLRAGERIRLDDVLHLMLIDSDNAAARVLARVSFGARFVQEMNAQAKRWNLHSTHFEDPAGLHRNNVSTAMEVAQMFAHVIQHPVIPTVMQKPSYTAQTSRRKITIRNTNRLVRDETVQVQAGKTGYIRAAGFCVASVVRSAKDTVIVIVLGARSNVSRFTESRKLLDFVNSIRDFTTYVVDGVPWQYFERLTSTLSKCGIQPAGISKLGVDFIKTHENFRSTAYKDASGTYAIGYGMHSWRGRKVTRKYPGRVSRAAADVEFMRQIPRFENIVRKSVCASLTQSQFDALVSVAWTLGRVNTRIIQKLEAGRSVSQRDFLVTATVRGRSIAGLRFRRLREFALFTGQLTEV
jgi:D-alanyl-D-alanine carboxypeptidase/GH24 family phage-related lysozyme (muramidase)